MRDTAAGHAVRLMPTTLRMLLEKHRDALIAGIREAARTPAGEQDPRHNLAENRGGPDAATSLSEAVTAAIEAINRQQPFDEVARHFGRVAHFAGDLTWPARVADTDPGEASWERDYATYTERHLHTFPVVFHGWKDRYLDREDGSVASRIVDFAGAAGGRTREYYPAISMAYDPANPRPVADRFDVRSLPYGIASLSWSHHVTDMARVWLFIWRQAHGDMHGTPLLEAGTPAGGDGATETP